jgi:hypothetical protein
MINDQTTIKLEWDFFIDKIIEEKCVLVLGPDVFLRPDGQSQHSALMTDLDVNNNPLVRRYYDDDDFFLFDELHKRTLICHKIKRFYNEQEPLEDLMKLSEIPFHIILTVTPDKILHKAFDKNNFSYQTGFYKKNREPQPIKSPTRSLPLIYNLFGSIDNEESLILTHNDLYDYFKSIFSHKSMPDKLKSQLSEIKNIIFLGVPFDKWYMQLLLRELDIHQYNYGFTRFAAILGLKHNRKTATL